MAELRLHDNALVPYQWGLLLEECEWGQNALRDPRPEPRRRQLQVAQLLFRGSIRGVRFELRGASVSGVSAARCTEVRVVLADLASREDYTAAYSLVSWAMSRGGGELRDRKGVPLDATRLTPDGASEDATRAFQRAARRLARRAHRDGLASVPVDQFGLVFELADLAAVADGDFARLETVFAERVTRHATALPSPALERESGRREATWSLVPSLVPDDVDVILIDGARRFLVRFESLLEVLGTRIERATPKYYLPGLDLTDDGELIAQLEASALPREKSSEEDPSLEATMEEAERHFASLVHDAQTLLATGLSLDETRTSLGEGPGDGLLELLFEVMRRVSIARTKGISEESIFAEEHRLGIPRPLVRGALAGLREFDAES